MSIEFKKKIADIFVGFSKLSYSERLSALQDVGLINVDELNYLKEGGLSSINLAEKFIENAIGYFQIPLGVATNFKIDGVDKFIPMAVEETSIIAAASKTAKWVRENGFIKTQVLGQDIIGQIQFAKIKNYSEFEKNILSEKDSLIQLANKNVAASMVLRGGGVTDISLRKISRGDGYDMAIVHVMMNPCDAMGANIINQVCEYLKDPLQKLTQENVSMCILTNLVDSKLTEAVVVLESVDPELAEKIEEASLFSQLDSYRAATNNKGVLNGIDPILLATGNDWRAVEAGVHAYACSTGQYRSITQWKRVGQQLIGTLKAPIVVGTVGGVTALHPSAKLALKIIDVNSANELSRVAAAVGLVQNLGALKALTTVGIIEGHMKLHIKNLSLGAGATETEMPIIIKKLEDILVQRKRVSLSNAIDVLNDYRKQSSH